VDRPVGFPWRDYRRFCLGVLRWSPLDFWQASVWDVMDAYDGWAISKGVKKQEPEKLTPDDVRELKRMMEEHD